MAGLVIAQPWFKNWFYFSNLTAFGRGEPGDPEHLKNSTERYRLAGNSLRSSVRLMAL